MRRPGGKRVPCTSRWLLRQPSEAARLRLFCLPYAGGSATIFAGWEQGMPDGVEVCPIQLPGRATRFDEPPFRQMEPLVRALAAELPPFLDRPFALFGHSMGAVIGFELARLLRATGGAEPQVLFVSASRSPEIDDGKREYALPDPEFVATLRRWNATPSELLDDRDALDLLLPIVRADFEVTQTYEYRDGPPLGCRIRAFSGIGDECATPELMRPWSRHTTGSFSLSALPGGHFLLERSRAALLAILAHEVSRVGPRAAAPLGGGL